MQELQESILASETIGQSCTAPAPMGSSSPSKENLVLYVPEVEEIRISPVIARKGYLNVLEHKTNGWKKRWVVSLKKEYKLYRRKLAYIVFSNVSFLFFSFFLRRQYVDHTF